MADNSDKTEKATPKRKREARKKGNVLQSKEVLTVATLAVSFFAIKALMPSIWRKLTFSMEHFIEEAAAFHVERTSILHLAAEVVQILALAVVPLCLIMALASIVVTMGQTKGLFTMKALAPKMNRLNPLQGLKRLISMQGLMELVKSILKIIVLGVIVYLQLKDSVMKIARMIDMSIPQVMVTVGDIIMNLVLSVCSVFIFIAAADYLFQWWQYEKNLRMSKQELKEEYKETEGDPQIKGKIRERQQSMARRRMMQQVPEADVVIRNPTHLAIAVRYRPEQDPAPMVLAKGADDLALRIVKVAEDAGVYITENVPLARGMYDLVEIDGYVPVEYYRPVAEVLAFVYNLREKEKAQGGGQKKS